MDVVTLASVAEHPFLDGLEPRYVEMFVNYATEVSFYPGEYLLKEMEEARDFYLIRQGKVAIETFVPGRGQATIQYVTDGDIVGWSWLIPPYNWQFSALAAEQTDAFRIDGRRLRHKFRHDCGFGVEVLMQVAAVMSQRLKMTRLYLT